MSGLLLIKETDFEVHVLQSTLPVLVEFGASWCGPCAKQQPILQQLSEDFFNKIKIVKLDVDEAHKLIKKYFITSVPTFLIFNNGNKINTKCGFSSLEDLKIFLSQIGI